MPAPRRGLNESTNRYWGYAAVALLVGAGWSMDVSVHYKRGQWRLRSATRASVLGDGLLERGRSTSLALLGLTAAVGLAMVALALNQGWPLIAGAPIPGFGDTHQAVGDATIAAEAKGSSGLGTALPSTAGRQGPQASTRPARKGAGGTPAPAGSQAPGPEGIVVSHSTPASSPDDSSSGGGSPGGAAPSPAPVAQQPASTPVPEPASSPAAPPPSPAPQPAPESAAPSQPTLVSDESGEHDHGHHFGRGGSGSYSHSRSREDSAGSESSGEPEPAPGPPDAPPPDSDTPEEPESQSYAPPWSHGGSHGYGHDHDHGHW